MGKERALPPVWLMGMGFIPLGATGSLGLITTPTLLASAHTPEPQIAWATSLYLVAGFISFVLGPLIDWRWPRRTYAVLFAVLGAIGQFVSLLFVHDVTTLGWLMFATSMVVALNNSAVGGWFGNLTPTDRKASLGAWFTVANLGCGGVVAAIAIPLLRDLPFVVGAAILSATVLLPLPIYLWTPCPPADHQLAHESFRAFARDVLKLLRKPAVLWTLPLFLAPSASFALTNTLGGFGRDFHTPEQVVGIVGGVGVTIAGVFGSLLVPRLAEKINPRPLYLLVGLVGAAFTLLLIVLPRNAAVFGLAMLGENVFQAAAFTVANIITLRTIGHNNPLAATQWGLLIAATVLPLVYMQEIDGNAYSLGGVAGSFLADALISAAACALLWLMLRLWRSRIPAI